MFQLQMLKNLKEMQIIWNVLEYYFLNAKEFVTKIIMN
jgi:hypothetical protein